VSAAAAAVPVGVLDSDFASFGFAQDEEIGYAIDACERRCRAPSFLILSKVEGRTI
jgi:hypothetical protein